MPADRRVDQMFELLRRVREVLAEGRRSLTATEADRWKALALLRWEMLHALGRLSEYKQSYLLDPARLKGTPELTERARRLVESNWALLDAYQRFVERWALTSPLSVDAAYQAEALQMNQRISRHMEEDGRLIDALLPDIEA